MDIEIEKYVNDQMEKLAAKNASIIGPLAALPKNVLMTYLTFAAATGLLGGAGLGLASSYVKNKNPKLVALSRKKEFYDKKVNEMANENWLNEVLSIKKKLETSRLSDEERTALESKYKKLLDK